MQRHVSRRSALTAIGAGIATGGLFASTVTARTNTFTAELNTVREATQQFRDVAVAKDAGYRFFGVVPHAGVVYEKLPENMGKLGLTDEPTLLFYAPSQELSAGDTEADVDETNLALAGIEKHVSGRHDDAPANIFSDETADRRLKVSEEDGWHPNPSGGPITGIHVWVHMANPNGVFGLEHPLMLNRLSD